MYACPQCGESGQVLRLKDYWRSLSQDAEAKRDLAQPPEYTARWLVPIGLVALAAFVLSNGNMLGLLVLLAGLGVGGWMWLATTAAQAARERWERLMYCRTCPAQFEPGGA